MSSVKCILYITTVIICNLLEVKCSQDIQLQTNCTKDEECGLNSVCSTDRKCICRLGFETDGVNCVQFNCTRDGDCVQFSEHTFCDESNRRCQCDEQSGWVLLHETQQCIASKQFVNASCNAVNLHCGTNVICDLNQRCKCLLGFEQDPKGLINCIQFECSHSAECSTQFDRNSICMGKRCQCDADMGYTVLAGTQQCVYRNKPLGDTCLGDYQCGHSAACVRAKCRCAFGNKPKNAVDCQAVVCKSDADCEMVDANSYCHEQSCLCKPGHSLNATQQVCEAKSSALSAALSTVLHLLFLAMLSTFERNLLYSH